MSSIDATAAIAIRTTAGRQIGFGHLRRCLTLAGELVRRGRRVSFWLDGDEDTPTLVERAGFEAHLIARAEPDASADLVDRHRPAALLVDSYAMDETYFAAVYPKVNCVAVIDDLANRVLHADLVVNSTANAEALGYRLSPGCQLLLGTRYALLRPSFRNRPTRRAVERVGRTLIILGGADPTGAAPLVLQDVAAALPDSRIDLVVGPLFTNLSSLNKVADRLGDKVSLHVAPPDPIDLMAVADLAVSAGGQTLYELAACGVPTVALCVADNQRGNMDALARAGVVRDGGRHDLAGRFLRVREEVARLAADSAARQSMSRAGQAMVDGEGSYRVAEALCDRIERGRRAMT